MDDRKSHWLLPRQLELMFFFYSQLSAFSASMERKEVYNSAPLEWYTARLYKNSPLKTMDMFKTIHFKTPRVYNSRLS